MLLHLCGTALTEEQAKLLRKYNKQIVFSYDADGAGQNAIMRGIEILEKEKCDARVVQLDEEVKDPDEYVLKYGSGRFQMLVDKAISLVEFQIKMIKNEYDLDNVKDKINFLKRITIILSKVENKIERDLYVENISKTYNISKQALYAEINKVSGTQKLSDNLIKMTHPVKITRNGVYDDKSKKRENMIIYLMINNPKESLDIINSNIDKNDFNIEENKIIFEKINESNFVETDKIIQLIANIENENIQKHISEIMVTDYEITSVKKCLDDLIYAYTREKLHNQKIDILNKLDSSNLSKDEIAGLERELSDIIIKLAKIK